MFDRVPDPILGGAEGAAGHRARGGLSVLCMLASRTADEVADVVGSVLAESVVDAEHLLRGVSGTEIVTPEFVDRSSFLERQFMSR